MKLILLFYKLMTVQIQIEIKFISKMLKYVYLFI